MKTLVFIEWYAELDTPGLSYKNAGRRPLTEADR
jgi:hypothetical protein